MVEAWGHRVLLGKPFVSDYDEMRKEESNSENNTHLAIPVVERLRDDRLKRRELFIRHVQRAQKVLLQQRHAGEGEQKRRRERLAPEH